MLFAIFTLIAQASPDVTGGLVTGGAAAGGAAATGTGAAAVTSIVLLVRYYNGRLEKLMEAQRSAYETLIKDEREAAEKRNGEWVEVVKQVVTAMEHNSSSQRELNAGLGELRSAMQGLSARVDRFEEHRGTRRA